MKKVSVLSNFFFCNCNGALKKKKKKATGLILLSLAHEPALHDPYNVFLAISHLCRKRRLYFLYHKLHMELVCYLATGVILSSFVLLEVPIFSLSGASLTFSVIYYFCELFITGFLFFYHSCTGLIAFMWEIEMLFHISLIGAWSWFCASRATLC